MENSDKNIFYPPLDKLIMICYKYSLCGGKWLKVALLGKYVHSLDRKNRLILPSKLRNKEKKFILTLGFDNCIYIYTQKNWEKIMEKLDNISLKNKKMERAFKRYFISLAHETEIDTQGRMLIPKELLHLAELKNDVVIVGMKNRIEIWDKDRWERYHSGLKKIWMKLSQKLEI